MADTDGNEWVLLDTDLTARLAILPSAMSHLYFVLNEPGSGELKIPLESNAAALIESGQFAQASYRGGARGGFFVDNIQKQQADASEGGGKWLSISGRGGLALLEDAIVWDDGTIASTREFAAMTKADILITLIDEAQARGGLAALTYDFSATLDSDGVSWTDSESYQLSVGTSVLDVLRQFAKTGIDFDIVYSSGSFVLSAYKNGKGTDKSETIYFRTGVNCEEVKSDERGDAIKNALRVAYKAGNVTITDGTSITNRRRREKLLDARLAQTAASATTYGSAILVNSKDPRKGISVKIYDGVGPRVFLDYDLGDYIMLDVEGTETSYRVLGIQLDWDGKDYSNVVVELNSLLYENEIRMAQDIDFLLDQWETARDADLMEVSFWAAIGDASTTYNVSDFCIIGDYLYMINGSTTILKYGLKNGIWYPIVLTSLPNCLAAVGTNLYIGGLLQVIKYDTLTDTQTSVTVADTGSPLSANVTAFAVNGTTLYAGGQFTSINGVAAVNIAQLNTLTSTWSSMADAASFLVTVPTLLHMLYSNGILYSSAGTQVQGWNGTVWSNKGSAFDGNVLTFAEYGTFLLAGGQMSAGIWTWDGSAWSEFGGGISAAVRALGVYLTDVYIGGSFTDVGNYVARYSGGTWWQLETGTNALVDAMILNGSDLYVGGDFTAVGNTDKPAQGIAAYFNNFESLSNYLENASSSFNMGAAIHAAAASAITDTDEVPFWEASVNALRKITWANILTTIRTWLLSATATTQVLYNDAGAIGSDSELTYDKTYNVLEVGGTNWYTGATRSNSVQVTTETGGASSHVLLGHSYQDGTGNFLGVPSLGGDRAGGTKASPTAVLNDMGLARFVGGGYDGTTLSGTRAQIVFKSIADWTASSHPTNIEFWTTPSGSTTRELKFVVGTSGVASNITAGKTLTLTATDNFTLTVPATGTAALLATANVFTTVQTITPASPTDGTDLMKFTATNAWTLQQSGTGSSAMLEFFSDTADKYFRFNPNSNTAGGLIVANTMPTGTLERFMVEGTGDIKAQVSTLSTTGYAFFRLKNDAGTVANFGAFGSARAGTLFGINQAGLFAIYGSLPFVIGTTDTNTFTLGNNNAARVSIGALVTNQVAVNYAADAQASDTYVITLAPALLAYSAGLEINFKANTANTGAATINVNGLGAKTIVKAVSTTLANNDILAGMFCKLIYDGTNFVLLNPRAL